MHTPAPDSTAPLAGASAVEWRCPSWRELSVDDCYAVLQLRQLVFVVEQRCAFLDADGADDRAWHLLGWQRDGGGRRLVAYARLFAPGAMYDEASIGRVATHPAVRRGGMGRALVREAIARLAALAPGAPIRIGAQRYLERWYEEFGFRAVSDEYDEDGIPHIEMRRP